MKLEGLILDESDIIQDTKINRSTGETETMGKINLITTNPTDKIQVTVSPELWANGKAGEILKRLVGNRHQYSIQYKEMSFGDKDGKHVALNGFHLFELPQIKGQ